MLTVSKINSLKPIYKNYKISDANGLRLQVKTNSTKLWLLDYRAPAVRSKKRCRMHGGAKGSGAQPFNQNALKHGYTTKDIKALKETVRQLLKSVTK